MPLYNPSKSSPSQFDASVGTLNNEDYSTLAAAIQDGKQSIVVSSATTETGNVIYYKNTTIFIAPNVVLDMGDFSFVPISDGVSLDFQCQGVVKWSPITPKNLFDSTIPGTPFQGNNVQFSQVITDIIPNTSGLLVGQSINSPNYGNATIVSIDSPTQITTNLTTSYNNTGGNGYVQPTTITITSYTANEDFSNVGGPVPNVAPGFYDGFVFVSPGGIATLWNDMGSGSVLTYNGTGGSNGFLTGFTDVLISQFDAADFPSNNFIPSGAGANTQGTIFTQNGVTPTWTNRSQNNQNNSAVLTIGSIYYLLFTNAGDDFTSIGFPFPITFNGEFAGFQFQATATTVNPGDWNNFTTITDSPVITNVGNPNICPLFNPNETYMIESYTALDDFSTIGGLPVIIVNQLPVAIPINTVGCIFRPDPSIAPGSLAAVCTTSTIRNVYGYINAPAAFNQFPAQGSQLYMDTYEIDATGALTGNCDIDEGFQTTVLSGLCTINLPNFSNWGYAKTNPFIEFKLVTLAFICFPSGPPNCHTLYKGAGSIDKIIFVGLFDFTNPLIDTTVIPGGLPAVIYDVAFLNIGIIMAPITIKTIIGGSFLGFTTNDTANINLEITVAADNVNLQNLNLGAGDLDIDSFQEVRLFNIVCNNILNDDPLTTRMNMVAATNIPTNVFPQPVIKNIQII